MVTIQKCLPLRNCFLKHILLKKVHVKIIKVINKCNKSIFSMLNIFNQIFLVFDIKAIVNLIIFILLIFQKEVGLYNLQF